MAGRTAVSFVGHRRRIRGHRYFRRENRRRVANRAPLGSGVWRRNGPRSERRNV